jgi:hypothetical protein
MTGSTKVVVLFEGNLEAILCVSRGVNELSNVLVAVLSRDS